MAPARMPGKTKFEQPPRARDVAANRGVHEAREQRHAAEVQDRSAGIHPRSGRGLEDLHQRARDVEQHDHRGLAPGFEADREQRDLDRDGHQGHEVVAPDRRVDRPEQPGSDQQRQHQRPEQTRPSLLYPEPEQLVREYTQPAAARCVRRDAPIDAVPAQPRCAQAGDHGVLPLGMAGSMGILGFRGDITYPRPLALGENGRDTS